MSTTAGALSKVSVGTTTASLSSAVATSGTAPYTYQWYKSTTTGFTPGVGNIIDGATSLTLSDTGLTPGQTYYYKVVATDDSATPVSATSAQLAVVTAPVQNQNQFSQAGVVGMLDQKFNYNTKEAQIDSSETGTLKPGQAVKIVDSAGGIPKVVAITANTDEVWGFINFSNKDQSFVAGDKCGISQKGNVMWMIATAAIARGVQVTVDKTYVGGVQTKNSGDRIVGHTYDKATAAGQLIRVELAVPSFTTA